MDQLESRRALAITGPLSIGSTTVGTYFDAPTGAANLGDFVTVSIEGTRGTVVFNGGAGVQDYTDIQTIEILNASPDFQLTFNASVTQASPVTYSSDGVVRMGAITTANVIRGINTVRGPVVNAAVSPLPPFGFTQTSAGSNTLFLEGDQSLVFPAGSFVSAAPLLPATGAASYGTVQSIAFDSGTNISTIVLSSSTPAGTTAGALTLAETVQPEFHLTSFVGVNFSNSKLREWGGLFVDVVDGADTVVNGQSIPDLGILLSNGLLPYSTIGIRRELAATMVLGTKAKSSTDGRVLVESATPESRIVIGPRAMKVDTNSRLEVIGGAGPFGASVVFTQNFIGVMNLASAATGQVSFTRGVGSTATLNAASWQAVDVTGDFAGRINSTGSYDKSRAVGIPSGAIAMTVSRNLTSTARVNAASVAEVAVGGAVRKGATVSAVEGIGLIVAGNSSGTVQSSFGEVVASVGGSVLAGSTFTTSGNAAVTVAGNFDGALTSRALRFFVGGNVSQASRIVARSVEDWLDTGTANFGIGGRLDGIVNVGVFDAAPNFSTVTLVGRGTGSTARFNVDRFETDNLVFNGNFAGNLRVLQDLRANLQFNGNVHRVTVGGRVGSFDVDKSTGVITPVPVSIGVTGRLAFLNSNSYFQAAVPGKTGTFWNDATKTSATGILTSGSYGKVVPTLQQVLPPTPPTPQTYTIPSTPGGYSASRLPVGTGIQVTFTAPASDGGLPVVYYEYSTNALAAPGVIAWRRFDVPSQGPGTDIPLTVDSNGGAWIPGTTYDVAVRAVNAMGPSIATAAQPVAISTVPAAPGGFSAVQAPSRTDIEVTFTAPASDGGSPVLYYEYSTNALAAPGVIAWRRFNSPSQGPGANIPLTVDSNGGAWIPGVSYDVAVRAVNAIGASVATDAQAVVAVPIVPGTPVGFSASLTPGGTNMQVTFAAPASDGGSPVLYYEYSTNGLAAPGVIAWRRFNSPSQGPGTDILVTVDSNGGAWIPGVTYDLAVRAVNAVGPSIATSAQAVTYPT